MSVDSVAAPSISGPHEERLSGRLLFWSLTAALAGFLFGFDTVVISGAEQTIQALWNLSPALHGAAIASALYGTVVGALLGGWLTDRWGRRTTLLWIGMLYFVSAVGTAWAPNVECFIAARLIGGVGIGVSTVVAPLYIAEIAPPQHRGRLAGMFQFNIVFGIVIAFVSNALFINTGAYAWRWMLGIAALPSLLYTALCFALPESPRDEAQLGQAKALIKRESRNGRRILVSQLVLLETEWVLRSRYEFSKEEIIGTFSGLLESVEFEIEDDSSVEQALYVWKDSNADFADCLIGARHKTLGCRATASFDSKALKLPGFISP